MTVANARINQTSIGAKNKDSGVNTEEGPFGPWMIVKKNQKRNKQNSGKVNGE